MPDATERFRQDLLSAITADAAATPPGHPNAVRARARRRRRTRGLLAATTALAVAAGTAATLALPVRDDAVPSRLAGSGAATPYVLDEGTASNGTWTLVVTEDDCIEHVRVDGRGGSCGLALPGRLAEASSFLTEDDGEPVVVVKGPVEDGTSRVTVELASRPPVEAVPVLVDGRLVFSARTPADARITDVVAVDARGDVLARLGALPPPPEVPATVETPIVKPVDDAVVQSELRRAVQAMQAHRSAEGTYTRDPDALGKYGFMSGKVLIFVPYADEDRYCIEAASSTDTTLVFNASDTGPGPRQGGCPEA